MPRNYNLLLNDILGSIRKILDYAGNDSIDVLARNEMKIDAIVRNFGHGSNQGNTSNCL